MGKQFANVNSQYGAPMGRHDNGPWPDEKRTIRLFRVRLNNGGYDDGGAYWGCGESLYCATDDDRFRRFVRAGSRLQAIVELQIEVGMLKAGTPTEYKRLRELESSGRISASGMLLRQELQALGY